ncbi:MAG: 2-amino-4-hydroxy-6-hydroxymethyldihydropteridine diphosphokinase [Alphaproteobacteria bacterium]|nr:2-amino-4-hydroxy-6-hydroxymethyldihydropteridine diphosphokinase [Alphaproteobacteria bacterium]
MMTRSVTLGLGGNLGNPPATMARALRLLDADIAIRVAAVSRLYRTPPWGKTDQDWFYNCCVLVETSLEPRAILEVCLEIERQLKRKRQERWGPRLIDIDVLTYGDMAVDEEGLSIPHPYMHERAFVLVPLQEIAADLIIQGRSVSRWAQDSDAAGIEPVSSDGEWWRDDDAV